MNEKKVELLAPAGTFACFLAAVNAGADAVYLGGERFGARAYAGNLTRDEIVEALQTAHIFGRKIYLTVNTLVKESEFQELIPYIEPLYQAGLDGAIVQDLGVLESLRGAFPDLALHASTQMAVTGSYGAAWLEQLGICRVVPARELSLDEIRDIKEKTGLEVECFIHGSMCYAYSGQCLFSSILGGRSGNRGRCAGPCRLPYTDGAGRTCYPLSLKDMYTLPMLPKLIRAGIDSFKIEGRMKSPEYVAGVTAMYRKYIDMYLADPQKPYKVLEEDEQLLKGLYIRSELCSGYYERHHDRSMVTLKEPGYSGNDQAVLDRIRERYIQQDMRLQVTGHVRIRAGEQAQLTLSCERASVTVQGDRASAAMNRPLSEDEIRKRIGKLGDTCFELAELAVDTDQGSFMPVSALNGLRREACTALGSALSGRRMTPAQEEGHSVPSGAPGAVPQRRADGKMPESRNALCALVATKEQLLAVQGCPGISCIYVDADLFLEGAQPEELLLPGRAYMLVLPYIFRKRSWKYLPAYQRLLESGWFKGVLVRGVDELGWLRGTGYAGRIEADHTVYAWNDAAWRACSRYFDQITLPLELNRKELGRLDMAICPASLVVYGHIPLMYSANCVRNTLDHCIKDAKDRDTIYHLTDRYKNVFPVVQDCIHCYNILYNTVPLSLHGQLGSILEKGYDTLRLDLSIEDAAQARAIAAYFQDAITGAQGSGGSPIRDHTNGHYKRGVD